jgi:hypothetical protein
MRQSVRGKTFILAGVAALSVLTASAAHAGWNTRFALPSVPLPKEMLGNWCNNEEENFRIQKKTGDDATYYTKRDECLERETPLIVRPDGWNEVWDNCPFTNVTEETNGAYLIYSQCEILAEGDGHGLGRYFTVNMEYQIINGQLVVRSVPEL